MNIETILREKGRNVVTITGEKSVLDAVHALVDKNIGGLVVVEGGHPVGIITERDILRLTAKAHGNLGSMVIQDVMTRDLVTATPGDDLKEMVDVMAEHRIRHLPVMEGEDLVGIVSIRDLVNACRVSAEDENTHLRDYIQGGG